jgi:hypothetical protein
MSDNLYGLWNLVGKTVTVKGTFALTGILERISGQYSTSYRVISPDGHMPAGRAVFSADWVSLVRGNTIFLRGAR